MTLLDKQAPGQTFDGFPGSLETKANVLPEPVAPLALLIPLGSLLRAAALYK